MNGSTTTANKNNVKTRTIIKLSTIRTASSKNQGKSIRCCQLRQLLSVKWIFVFAVIFSITSMYYVVVFRNLLDDDIISFHSNMNDKKNNQKRISGKEGRRKTDTSNNKKNRIDKKRKHKTKQDIIDDYVSTNASAAKSAKKMKKNNNDHDKSNNNNKPTSSNNHNNNENKKDNRNIKEIKKRRSDSSQKSSSSKLQVQPKKKEEPPKKYCKLAQYIQWYPTKVSGNDWKQRAPYFILGGAKKSGTSSLAHFLDQHPQIIPAYTKELLFFLDAQWDYDIDADDDDEEEEEEEDEGTNEEVVDVTAARKGLYQDEYFSNSDLISDPKHVSFDATPGYLFQSMTIPRRVLCTLPWVKFLFILREPIDRVWSNYNFLKSIPQMSTRMDISFEEWIRRDLKRLEKAGVIQPSDWNEDLLLSSTSISSKKKNKSKANGSSSSFYGSEKEDRAWGKYHHLVQTQDISKEGPIGRSLYIIQLRHWYKSMLEITGRDPTKEIYLVNHLELKHNTDKTYRRVLNFLNLKDHSLHSYDDRMVTDKIGTDHSNKPTMKASTRQMLQEFFEPYNEQLYEFLGNEWNGVWDYNDKDKITPKHSNKVSTRTNAVH